MGALRRLPGVYLVFALTIAVMIAGIVALSEFNLVVADSPPTQEEIDFATETTDLLQAELIAALLQEFAETTPDNVEQGKLAISLIFADDNSAFRLVGEIDPLGDNDKPQDSFEQASLALALSGQGNETVEKVKGKYFVRRSIPLSNFDPSCVACHAAFGPQNPDQFVGALMLKVPTDPDNIDKLSQ
jgi:hypothetical protein